ncbi:MAG: glycosyltransferase family 2 protein [Chloroflexi bacterium]|nr:glycosyltransferase family 2 protein [Chloroflexota bacterium]
MHPSAVDGADAGGRRHPETVSVVIPTKNEAANLPWVLERMPDWVDEILVVDGRSTDGTVEVARACRPNAVIVLERRPGKGAAVRAGFAAATGDIVVMIDADGSMDPVEIGRYVAAIQRGADLAKGSRRMAGGGSADITALRDVGNRALLLGANLLLGTRFSELCYGFMAVRRSAVADLHLVSDGFEIETEIVARAVRARQVIAEVPSFEYPRRAGESNLSVVRDGLRIVRTLFQVRTGIGRPALEPAADTVAVRGGRPGEFGGEFGVRTRSAAVAAIAGVAVAAGFALALLSAGT